MYLAQKEWLLSSYPPTSSSWVPDLLQFAESLGEPCLALLEGNEKDQQRTYLAFGEGWVLSSLSSPPRTPAPSDPLEQLRSFRQEHYPGQDCHSGIIGYLDYEWGLYWHKPDSLKFAPNYFFRLSPINLVLLPEDKKVVLEVFAENQNTLEKTFKHWENGLKKFLSNYTFTSSLYPSTTPPSTTSPSLPVSNGSPPIARNLDLKTWSSNFSPTEFLKQVERIQTHIQKGDITQGVLSQRFTLKEKVQPWSIYQRLRVLNPSPWLFCLFGEEGTLVGSSPELLVSTVGSRVQTRPIAGTRPRGIDPQEDENLAHELLQDKKERAEHTMLVSLGQEEIRRVATAGTVTVKDHFKVEKFSHVMHLVTTVEGELAPNYDSLDALKTLFPAGTLTGAPKVKAMEILQECESTRRGAYGGALGIYRWNGDLDFCITIRTLLIKDDEVSVQSGAGIVQDSIPQKEYQETLHKAQALFRAVESCSVI